MAVGFPVVHRREFMADMIFLAPFVEWPPELRAPIRSNAYGDTVFNEPFIEDITYSFRISSLLGIGDAICPYQSGSKS